MAGGLCVVATSSSAGKSIITALLAYHFRRLGYRVAPFKPQNMSLNSYPAVEGGEIAFAQAMQALAAGCMPSVRMNPVLLKPLGGLVEVVVAGRSLGVMSFHDYWFRVRGYVRRVVRECFEELSREYDLILIEGAGCAAEPNFIDGDVANLWLPSLYGVPAVMVADVERGGAFASILGSLSIMPKKQRVLVKGFIINKFRGSIDVLKPALEWLERRTGRRVLGVVPYDESMKLWPEDSMELESFGDGGVDVAVIAYPTISNFNDLEPLKLEGDVSVRIVRRPESLGRPHIIVLPGARNVFRALEWIKKHGFDEKIRRLAGESFILGVCGGHQILGRRVSDPHGMEAGAPAHAEALGLMDYTIVYGFEKITSITKAQATPNNYLVNDHQMVTGYEIHRGKTIYGGSKPAFLVVERSGRQCIDHDGSVDEHILTTMMHDLLWNDPVRCSLLKTACKLAGCNVSCRESGGLEKAVLERVEKAYSVFREFVDLDYIEKLVLGE